MLAKGTYKVIPTGMHTDPIVCYDSMLRILDVGKDKVLPFHDDCRADDGDSRLKPARFDYYAPETIDETCELLSSVRRRREGAGGRPEPRAAAEPGAGASPAVLVDVNRVAGLDRIEEGGDELRLGALVRQRVLEQDARVRHACPLLAEAAPLIGHVAIRNRGTVGGSIAHADPAAEIPAVVTALGAEVEVVGVRGRRGCKPRTSSSCRSRRRSHRTSCLLECASRRSRGAPVTRGSSWESHGDFALAGVGAVVSLSADGVITAGRASAAPASGRSRSPRGKRPTFSRGMRRRRSCLPRPRSAGGVGVRPDLRRPRDRRVPAPAHAGAHRTGARGGRCSAKDVDGDRKVVRIEVNEASSGSARSKSRRTLADFLRDDLGLTGTHLGCEHGVCGACTVLLDGASVRSCILYAVQAEGAAIKTVESLAPGPDELHPVQEAFRRCHGLQCGFCTPGFLMTAHELLRDTRSPGDDQIRQTISGNLCRCTGYQGIVEAIRLADELWQR